MSEAEKRLEKCVDALYKVLAIIAVEVDAMGVMAESTGRSINRAFEQYSAAHYELMHLEDEEEQ